MPQMAPLNWLTLFMFFLLIFLCFNLINYFSFIYKKSPLKKNKLNKTYNWKW